VTDEGPAALRAVADVSRETLGRLEVFVGLIRKWNAAENLVSAADLGMLWSRHIADCAQLPSLLPAARRWLDIGSGAGFPGIVVALTGPPGTTVALVEGNRRKCAFLRQAIRETEAAATVHEGRAEALLPNWSGPVDAVTARAVASLPTLLALAAPVLAAGAVGLFPKGRRARAEIDEAVLTADFDLIQHQGRIEPDGVILEVRNLRRKRPSATIG
jgi:16S rRNA (guanine527-N7)-methyltransferase